LTTLNGRPNDACYLLPIEDLTEPKDPRFPLISALATRLPYAVFVTVGVRGDLTSPTPQPSRHASLISAIRNSPDVPLIGEVKPASPSAGWIRPEVDAGDVAVRMVQGGAVGISVLTEPTFFHGSLANLLKVRAAVNVPVLMKDFIIDERQVIQASKVGADALLLIAQICPRLEKFYELALTLGIEPLVEIHSREDLDRVAPLRPRLVGVNNRDLETLEINIERTRELAPAVRQLCPEALIVSESGITTVEDVRLVLSEGADAVLVGSSLIRAGDVTSKVRQLVEARRVG